MCLVIYVILFGVLFNMVKNKTIIHSLNDYNEFKNYLSNIKDNQPKLYFFFTGKKKDNGRSWCIYCQLGYIYLNNFKIIYLNAIYVFFCFSGTCGQSISKRIEERYNLCLCRCWRQRLVSISAYYLF